MASNLQKGLASLVKGLETEGPNVRRIAQSIGENEATVRYWLKEKIVKKGFVIQAVPAWEAIGLRKIAAVVHVSKSYREMAPKIFVEMSESAYLGNYSGSALDDSYLLIANFPVEFQDKYSAFLLQLKDIGFLTQVDEVLPLEWSRVVPMRVDLYDFRKSAWEFDIAKEPRSSEMKIRPARKQKIDITDLLIVRKLQVDARMTAKKMADSFGFDYKKILRHHAHVTDRKLVPSYMVRWLGSKIDPQSGKPRTIMHTYLQAHVIIRGMGKDELGRLIYEMHRLPFLWFEAGGENYFCEVAIPLELANEALLHIKQATSPFEGRRRISIRAPWEAVSFSIAPELFDQKSKRWTFEPEKSLRRIENVLLTVKSSRA